MISGTSILQHRGKEQTNRRTRDKGTNKKELVGRKAQRPQRLYIDNLVRPVADCSHPHILDGRNVSNPRPPRDTSDRNNAISRLGRSRYRAALCHCYSCLLHNSSIDGSIIQWFVPWRPILGVGHAVFGLPLSQRCILPSQAASWHLDRMPDMTLQALHLTIQLGLARWIHIRPSRARSQRPTSTMSNLCKIESRPRMVDVSNPVS